jgi:hypothetical protein
VGHATNSNLVAVGPAACPQTQLKPCEY